MSNELEKKIWENRYQKHQTGWDRGKSSEGLFYWLNTGFLAPCRILIPGCGNGYEVIKLAEMGFDVTAIDIASTPINNLNVALTESSLDATVVQQDFFSWQSDILFDVIYEQTSLCALPPDLWQQYENKLYQWLKPEGVLLAQFMQTGQDGGPPYHCAMEDMRSIFPEERWVWSEQHNVLEMMTDKTELMFMLIKK